MCCSATNLHKIQTQTPLHSDNSHWNIWSEPKRQHHYQTGLGKDFYPGGHEWIRSRSLGGIRGGLAFRIAHIHLLNTGRYELRNSNIQIKTYSIQLIFCPHMQG